MEIKSDQMEILVKHPHAVLGNPDTILGNPNKILGSLGSNPRRSYNPRTSFVVPRTSFAVPRTTSQGRLGDPAPTSCDLLRGDPAGGSPRNCEGSPRKSLGSRN